MSPSFLFSSSQGTVFSFRLASSAASAERRSNRFSISSRIFRSAAGIIATAFVRPRGIYLQARAGQGKDDIH